MSIGLIRITGEVGTVKHVKALQELSYCPFQGIASFVDLLLVFAFYLCICHTGLSVCCILVITPAGKGLNSWLSCM